MATRRELLEAETYVRHRLVHALAPGTEDRSARPLLGGVVLVLLLVVAVILRGALSPRAPTGGEGPGLLIVRETGERFLVTERGGPLRPVLNVTSAQLVLGAHLIPAVVPASALAGRDRGPQVGIVGAPQRLPTADGLLASGWSACTADGSGVAFALARSPAVVTEPGRGAVVTVDGRRTWVVAEDAAGYAGRYRVPMPGRSEALLVAVGLPPVTQAVRVPAAWLALLPVAGRLGPATWVRAHWSATTLRPLAAPICAELVTGASAPPYVRLGTLPPGTAWTAPAPGEVTRTAAPGSGALVSGGSRTWIVDDRAVASPLMDQQTVGALGFGDVAAPEVPEAWLGLLGTGVPLSRDLALRPTDPGRSSDDD